MLRFARNRWWAFILALIICLAPVSTVPRTASAESGTQYDGGSGQDPGGTATGDPDNPSGQGKTLRRGNMIRGSMSIDTRTVGDSRLSSSVVMWRLRVLLYNLRSILFRF